MLSSSLISDACGGGWLIEETERIRTKNVEKKEALSQKRDALKKDAGNAEEKER